MCEKERAQKARPLLPLPLKHFIKGVKNPRNYGVFDQLFY
jgi:hypothetical protein